MCHMQFKHAVHLFKNVDLQTFSEINHIWIWHLSLATWYMNNVMIKFTICFNLHQQCCGIRIAHDSWIILCVQWEWSDIHPSCGFGVTHIHSWIILGVPYLICMGYSSYLPILKRIYSCNSNTLASAFSIILWMQLYLHWYSNMLQWKCIYKTVIWEY
jgi:hypothetical protein